MVRAFWLLPLPRTLADRLKSDAMDDTRLIETPTSQVQRDERLASMSPDELRTAMRTLGYRTQNDLAHAIGVSRSAVSLWLEGKVGVPRPVAMLHRMLVAAQRRAF
jgi:DNA-binding transcriptional regulator YiaG